MAKITISATVLFGFLLLAQTLSQNQNGQNSGFTPFIVNNQQQPPQQTFQGQGSRFQQQGQQNQRFQQQFQQQQTQNNQGFQQQQHQNNQGFQQQPQNNQQFQQPPQNNQQFQQIPQQQPQNNQQQLLQQQPQINQQFQEQQQQSPRPPQQTTDAQQPVENSPSESKSMSESCLACICQASTNCKLATPCMSNGAQKLCGPFLISKPYWIDAGKPTLIDDTPEREGAFEDCATDPICAAQAVRKYMNSFRKDCNRDGKIDCVDLTRIHLMGPFDCSNPDATTTPFYRKFMQCWNRVQQLSVK